MTSPPLEPGFVGLGIMGAPTCGHWISASRPFNAPGCDCLDVPVSGSEVGAKV